MHFNIHTLVMIPKNASKLTMETCPFNTKLFGASREMGAPIGARR
jgi:hypothetical protein